MDGRKFDTLTRSLVATSSRRLALSAGMSSLGLLIGNVHGSTAGKKKRKGRNNKKDNKPKCPRKSDLTKTQVCGQTCCDPVKGPCCKGNICCADGLKCCGGEICCAACKASGSKECCESPATVCGDACCASTFTCCSNPDSVASCCPPGSAPCGRCPTGLCGCCPAGLRCCGNSCCLGACCSDGSGTCARADGSCDPVGTFPNFCGIPY